MFKVRPTFCPVCDYNAVPYKSHFRPLKTQYMKPPPYATRDTTTGVRCCGTSNHHFLFGHMEATKTAFNPEKLII